MIKVISCADWKFADRVDVWLNQLGDGYEVYDCKLVSSYDTACGEVWITAVFFYRGAENHGKVNFDEEAIKIELNEADKELAKRLFEENSNINANLKQNFTNHNYSNEIKTDYAELKNSLNKMFDELEDIVVDKSEPYARGKMRR